MRPALLAALALLATTGTAEAHARLTASTPAANATVAPTSTLSLTFSEALVEKLSGAELTLTGMPGMKMAPMKVPVKATLGADRKSLQLAAEKPLIAGSYKLEYHVVSADTHRIKGGFAFTVK